MHFSNQVENMLFYTASQKNPSLLSTTTRNLLASSGFVLTNQKASLISVKQMGACLIYPYNGN